MPIRHGSPLQRWQGGAGAASMGSSFPLPEGFRVVLEMDRAQGKVQTRLGAPGGRQETGSQPEGPAAFHG